MSLDDWTFRPLRAAVARMAMTLGEVLGLDALQRAAPEVLVGQDQLDRPVRWVHTSELAEAAYLLKGGELLLTTGLGISGRGAVGETAYVAALAHRGAAALALELGWTFPAVPAALVRACEEQRLPLFVLHEVVPFVEITEQVQTALLERSGESARRDRDVRQRLTDALLSGGGPQELAAVLADAVAAPVVVTTAEGALVAAAGDRLRSARTAVRPVARRDVVLLDRHWGHVAVLPPARADDPAVATVCSHGAEALGLALLRSAAGDDLAVRRRQLVDDLMERRWRSPGELVGRARVLGVVFTSVGRYVAMLVTFGGTSASDAVAREVAGALPPGTALVAEAGDVVVAVVRTSGARGAGQAVLEALDRAGLRAVRVVVGTVVSRLEDVHQSISRARRAAELVDGDRLVLAGTMTTQLLLSELLEQPLADQLIREEIGPLLEQDRARGTELVKTLRVYLSHSSSKVETARVLRIRRQTLYSRLERIGELIGDIRDPHRHTALVHALALTELRAATPARPATSIDD